MDETELKDLENPENWDWENAETKSGTRNRRTIVSVGFAREDFEKVAKVAERLGLNISSFIRYAVLEKVAMEASRHDLISSDPITSALQPVSTTKLRWVTMHPDRGIRTPDMAVTEATPARFLVSPS